MQPYEGYQASSDYTLRTISKEASANKLRFKHTVAIENPEKLLQIIPDWFIKKERRAEKDSAHYMRATIILGVVLLSSFFDALLLLLLWLSPYPQDPQQRSIALGITAAVLFCYLASLVYYRSRQTIIGPANLYAVGVLFATSLPGVITGGFLYSPNMQIIIVVPVWAFLMAGRRYGLLWTAITLLVLFAYYLLEINGVVMPQGIPEQYMASIKLLTWLVSISLVVVCLFIYEISVSILTTRLNEEQRKLAYEATHDSLTGLLNRKSLQTSINLALDAHRRHGKVAALFYIDLDDFKPINDNHGHNVGDEVLAIITSKLKSCTRNTDTVARIGGDEFGVLLQNIEDSDVVTTIAQKILEALNQKITLRKSTFQVSASIGIALIPKDGDEVDAIITRADQAMYEAKKHKNHITFCGNNNSDGTLKD